MVLKAEKSLEKAEDELAVAKDGVAALDDKVAAGRITVGWAEKEQAANAVVSARGKVEKAKRTLDKAMDEREVRLYPHPAACTCVRCVRLRLDLLEQQARRDRLQRRLRPLRMTGHILWVALKRLPLVLAIALVVLYLYHALYRAVGLDWALEATMQDVYVIVRCPHKPQAILDWIQRPENFTGPSVDLVGDWVNKVCQGIPLRGLGIGILK